VIGLVVPHLRHFFVVTLVFRLAPVVIVAVGAEIVARIVSGIVSGIVSRIGAGIELESKGREKASSLSQLF
jgi:hypothetical protein